MPAVRPVTWVVPGLTVRDEQFAVIAASVQVVAVYDAGAVAPEDPANVTEIAPAVVFDDATDRLPGVPTWLTAACGADTADEGEAR